MRQKGTLRRPKSAKKEPNECPEAPTERQHQPKRRINFFVLFTLASHKLFLFYFDVASAFSFYLLWRRISF